MKHTCPECELNSENYLDRIKKLQAENKKMWHENRALIKKNELIVKSSSTGILTGIVGSIYIQDRLLELEAEKDKLVNVMTNIQWETTGHVSDVARRCLKELKGGE